jgi:hypothetical protein
VRGPEHDAEPATPQLLDLLELRAAHTGKQADRAGMQAGTKPLRDDGLNIKACVRAAGKGSYTVNPAGSAARQALRLLRWPAA